MALIMASSPGYPLLFTGLLLIRLIQISNPQNNLFFLGYLSLSRVYMSTFQQINQTKNEKHIQICSFSVRYRGYGRL
jgi:hypothetical protein